MSKEKLTNKLPGGVKYYKQISIKMLIITSIIVFILSIGSTYAVLTWNSDNTLISGNTLCFSIGYSKGQDITFGTVNSSGEVVNGMTASTSFNRNTSASTTVGFKRKNNCLIYGKGTIKVNISSTADLSTGALKYIIYDNNDTQIKTGSITTSGESTIYDNFDIINTVTYTIYFWLDSNYIDNSYLEATFTGTIDASARSAPAYGPITEEDPASYTYFYSQATLDTDAGVDFSKTSQQNGTNGLYIFSETKDDFYPVVYYRGNVNNNLIFADTCWKIIRTTESGGLRLIYNGVPSSGTCNNTGTASQLTTKEFNVTSSPNIGYSAAGVGYMYGTKYVRTTSTGTGWYYAPDVSYSGGSYTLKANENYNVETKSTISGTNLNYQHYTCGSSTATTCTQVRYVYYVSSTTAYYITLSNGKKVEDALSEMLDYNTTSSTIKGNGASATDGTVDYWYKNNIDNNSTYKNLIDYNEIFCNDRSIYALNGWNPDGGSTSAYLYFGAYGRLHTTPAQYTPIVTCPRNIDKFTVNTASIGNKALTYPVGLITADEVIIAGAKFGTSNSDYYLFTGQNLWTISPSNIDGGARLFRVNYEGHLGNSSAIETSIGVRPVIALKAGYLITGGDGSTDSPYTVSAGS